MLWRKRKKIRCPNSHTRADRGDDPAELVRPQRLRFSMKMQIVLVELTRLAKTASIENINDTPAEFENAFVL